MRTATTARPKPKTIPGLSVSLRLRAADYLALSIILDEGSGSKSDAMRDALFGQALAGLGRSRIRSMLLSLIAEAVSQKAHPRAKALRDALAALNQTRRIPS